MSDVELAKFVELGHLQPTDLLWREGFPDWRPALVVFPPQQRPTVPQPSAQAGSAQPGAQAGRAGPDPSFARQKPGADFDDGRDEGPTESGEAEPSRRSLVKILAVLAIAGVLGGGGWYAFKHRSEMAKLVRSVPSVAPGEAALPPVDKRSLDASPFKGFSGSADTIDRNLQASALWRVLKREFPDWYAERLKEAADLASQNKDENAIAQQMARAMVALRRQQVSNALSSSMPRLKNVATTFFDNIVELRKYSIDACFAYLSQGEASPVVVSLLQDPAHTAHLQAQLTAVFEAIADGRKSPRVYPSPRKADYELLAKELTKRGWSQADMQLFSDERALARAPPEKVCQLVHDWFATQLGLSDADLQFRLLVESLRPIVAG